MPYIPESVIPDFAPGLKLLRRGKVRDTHELPGHEDMLLVIASDRISVFDLVLGTLIPYKGVVLNAMNVFWRTNVLEGCFPHDLIAHGTAIDHFLPGSLRGNRELQSRATVVRKMKMLPVECIVRGHLTGSGLKDYEKSRMVGGHALPLRLKDGSLLPYPIFTPSTKADSGHDINISADAVANAYGVELERFSLQIYTLLANYARERGIILADTKFEFGETIGDEIGTPDSSRFWDLIDWARNQRKGKAPTSLDKQFVRDWAKEQGINEMSPTEAAAVAIPKYVERHTSALYRHIFGRLVGRSLADYILEDFGVDLPRNPVNIVVLLGSISDIPQVAAGLEVLEGAQAIGRVQFKLHVCSADRNPETLTSLAQGMPLATDAIIAAAGKTAVLPGRILQLLHQHTGARVPVLGVALEGSSVEDTEAARLSIKCGLQPVQYAGYDGQQWIGSAGFEAACRFAFEQDLLPPEPTKHKDPILNAESSWRQFLPAPKST